MTFSDALQPGSVPWPLPSDNPQDFPTDFASDTWPVLWPKITFTFASIAARDAAISGLSSTDRAFAFVEDSKTFWRWNGTSWGLASPWTQIGTASLGAVAVGTPVDVTVTFPVAFTDAGYIPSVMTSFQAKECTVTVVSRSAASMQLRFTNVGTATSSAGATVYWTATRVL